jgi:hypothetical protein
MASSGGSACFALVLFSVGFTGVSADGHGVFCSTQFNWWVKHAPGAQEKLLSLAKNYNDKLTVCDMMHNANAKYHQFVEARGLGLPNGGGNSVVCGPKEDFSIGQWYFGDLGGIPAGGCAFSYPAISHSTCRLKILGPDHEKELQWCQMDIEKTMKIGTGSDGSSNPDKDLSCELHTDFDVVGSENTGKGNELPYVSKWILMNTFINTLVDVPGCSAMVTAQVGSLASAGSEGRNPEAWVLLLIGGAAGVIVGAFGMLGVGAIIKRRGKVCNQCLIKPLCPREREAACTTDAPAGDTSNTPI